MKIYASQNNDNYYIVNVYNRHNYSHKQSPKFGTKGECYQWIRSMIFDAGAEVEIREVSTTSVSHDQYSVYDPTAYDIPNSAYGDGKYISQSLYEYGCISKDKLSKYLRESEV